MACLCTFRSFSVPLSLDDSKGDTAEGSLSNLWLSLWVSLMESERALWEEGGAGAGVTGWGVEATWATSPRMRAVISAA